MPFKIISTSQSIFTSMELKIKSGLIQTRNCHILGCLMWGQKNRKKPNQACTENGVFTLTWAQMVSLHQQTKSIITLDTSKPLIPLEKNQSALIYSKVAEKSEKWRMTSCSGKFITSLVATLQSFLLEQELELQIYGKYFHVSLL